MKVDMPIKQTSSNPRMIHVRQEYFQQCKNWILGIKWQYVESFNCVQIKLLVWAVPETTWLCAKKF